MNPYNFSVLLFSFSSFMLSLLVWANRRDRIGRIFFIYNCSVVCWGVPYALMISDNLSPNAVLWAARVANASAVLIGPASFHFAAAYAECSGKTIRKWIAAAYTVSFAIVGFVGSPLFVKDTQVTVHYMNYPLPGPLYHGLTAIFIVLTTAAFVLLFRRMNYVRPEARTQIKGLIFSAAWGYLGGILSFLPAYGIPCPQYGLFVMPLYPFGIAFFMIKNKLFNAESLAQAARRDKMAAMGILAASINHEVRSPLFVIRGLAETFMTQKAEGALAAVLVDQAEKGFQKTIQQTDRAMGMIKRLSTFAKREVDAEYAPQAVNVRQLLEDLFPLLRHELDSLAVQVTVSVPQDLKPLQADPGYLEEIVFNLMVNALQALKQAEGQRTLELKAEPVGDGVSIRIADNGPGIATDQLGLIFQPFYSTKEEGTGLGLYITKRLVEKCGGTIRVESVPGWGTQFILEFRAV